MSVAIEPLLSAQEIRERIQQMASELAPRLSPGVVVVSLLKGAMVFTADLLRELSGRGLQPRLDFMVLASYGSATTSSGNITLKLDCQENLCDQHILLLDDILDSGRTLAFAVNHLLKKGVASITTAVLLDKPERREVAMHPDCIGFVIPNLFVVGYGVDYAERFRELPFIGHIQS